MTMNMNPDEAVEGGDFPRGNLLVTEAHYGPQEYMRRTGANSDGTPKLERSTGDDGKPLPAFMALHLTLRSDDSTEFLQYYSMERFLYRLSRSAHAPHFVLPDRDRSTAAGRPKIRHVATNAVTSSFHPSLSKSTARKRQVSSSNIG